MHGRLLLCCLLISSFLAGVFLLLPFAARSSQEFVGTPQLVRHRGLSQQRRRVLLHAALWTWIAACDCLVRLLCIRTHRLLLPYKHHPLLRNAFSFVFSGFLSCMTHFTSWIFDFPSISRAFAMKIIRNVGGSSSLRC
jgi:hypothetical protein